jgi:MtrB/PioB family decaheme-associated outer membrane protein
MFMRIRHTLTTGALVLACAGVSQAQTAPAATGTTLFGLKGTIDFGLRGTGAEGDEARYERYQDLRSGVFSRVVLGDETERRRVGVRLENIGYRNGFYGAEYHTGRSRFAGSVDSIPLNYSYLTSTPWVEGATGVFELDDVAQSLVQNRTPGVVGIHSAAAQLVTPSIYRGLARPFDLQSRRDTISASLGHDLNAQLGFNVSVSSIKKGGNQPYGMSFAFNNANELPIPLDNRTNNMAANLEYGTSQGSIRVGWEASYFNNQIQEIVWDNPLRATDFTPYDPSGYSNGNGPARGRMAMPPSNSMNTVSTVGIYKLAARTTVSGSLAFTAMNQNEALIPWTSNPAVANAGVYETFPGLASLPRATAEAKVHGLNGVFTLTSRPNNIFGLNMRYRVNDHRNLTPAFDAREYVRFDAVPEDIEHGISQNFNVRQNTFDLTGTFKVARHTAINIGYIFDDYERTGRSFSDMRDYTFRTSVDTLGNRWVTVRASFDHTTRIGSGFSEASIEDGGLQPGLRFYDESDRDRDRGALLFVFTPGSSMDVTLQFAKGRDIYKGEGHEFGLLNNDNETVNIGTSYSPVDKVTLGANYGRDKYNSLQSSRNANPPCGLNVPPCAPGTYDSWFDPNRTWLLDNDEVVNNVLTFVDIEQVIPKTDIRFSYDYSDSDQAFMHSGPRITALATNTILTTGDTRPCAAGVSSCFEALPNVTNKWHRLTADVRYGITSKVGVAASYWYEKLDITDFATLDLAAGVPRIDYLGLLSTGYGNRPYKGSTGSVRLLYTF